MSKKVRSKIDTKYLQSYLEVWKWIFISSQAKVSLTKCNLICLSHFYFLTIHISFITATAFTKRHRHEARISSNHLQQFPFSTGRLKGDTKISVLSKKMCTWLYLYFFRKFLYLIKYIQWATVANVRSYNGLFLFLILILFSKRFGNKWYLIWKP